MFDYQAPARLLQDRVILITGAGDGLGRSAALTYAVHGATVILLGKTVEKLEKTYDTIEAAGGPQPAIFPLDLETATESQYRELAEGIETEFGRLDGLLHNAGILGIRAPVQAVSINDWNRVIQVNLNAVFALTRHLLPLLQLPDTASVIFTSSGVGREPRAFWGAYSVSKFGVEALMQILHQELEKTSSVRVNSINPGACATRMRAQAYPGENPGTLPKPEELMTVYLYLMGDDSVGISGEQFNAQ